MKRIIAVFCIVLVCITLVACAAEPKSEKETIIGTWVYDDDKSMCMIFNEDGSVELQQNGNRISARVYFYFSEGKLWLGEYGYKYELNRNQLTVYAPEGTAVLRRK